MSKHNKFFSIDINAAKKIVQEKEYQSIDYNKGQELSQLIKDEIPYRDNFLYSESIDEGCLLRTDLFERSKTLIFDLDTFEGFNTCTHRDSLVLFQKMCRLAIKLWEGMTLNSSENSIDNRFIILSPFSFKKGYFKASLDKSPDEKRQQKRGGQHFLVFKSGFDQFELKPTSTNFRKSIDAYRSVKALIRNDEIKEKNGLNTFVLDKPKTEVSEFIGFDGIKGLLTDTQKQFIYSDTSGPSRLEGAAGTGKTLTLILKCIHTLESAKINNINKKVLFITHSSETKKNIESIFLANSGEEFIYNSEQQLDIYVQITTLQEWCIELLGTKISETEYLDKDAQDSKELQQLYLNDIIEKFIKEDLDVFSRMISTQLFEYFKNEEPLIIAELLQNEISTYIKGRAGENLERYKKVVRSKYILPIESDDDYDCIFSLYAEYQRQLEAIGQFDSDDIVLTAIGELETPIWRRRRSIEGFESIFVDETHLFNINELCLFHYLTKPKCSTNMIFTIDRSQAIGDSTLSKGDVSNALNLNEDLNVKGLTTVFRSSPDILNFASYILSSGATLFTNFENPLEGAVGSFTMEDERKCIKPTIKKYINDEQMICEGFNDVIAIASQLKCSRNRVIIIPTTDSLCRDVEEYAKENNKAFEVIKNRGDIEKVNLAEKGGKYIISGMDYVGGLEFDAVVILGADKGRVPPTNTGANVDSKHYLTYVTYNRLYVAITRAKYALLITYTATRGISDIFQEAIDSEVIDITA